MPVSTQKRDSRGATAGPSLEYGHAPTRSEPPCTLDSVQIPFEGIPLEKEQKDLLADMVDAQRAVAPQDRQEFLLIGTMSGHFMHHPGLKREAVYPGDLHERANWGLLRLSDRICKLFGRPQMFAGGRG